MSKKEVNYNFEWDHKKANKNITKHRVSFERAASVFLDPNAISVYDEDHEEHEERWITIGMDKSLNLLVVCHTFNQVADETFSIRIISARKPTKHEIKQYKEIL